MIKLSHSAASKYIACGEMYRLHYIEKIRPIEAKSSLLFGAAFDQGLNAALENKGDPYEIFEKSLREFDLNGSKVFVPTSKEIQYTAADLDMELAALAPDQSFNPEYNSMLIRGRIMLRDYITHVLPQLEVIAVQEPIKLTNTEGDVVTGIVDLVAKYQGDVVIFDNKTTGRPYKKDSVLTSEQLALYTHALEDKYHTRKAGFIAINKNIKKNRVKICESCGFDGTGKQHKTCNNLLSSGDRCGSNWTETIAPSAMIQIIVDNILPEVESAVIENLDTINDNIKANHFPKNTATCYNFYGSRCPYFNLCHAGSEAGLYHVKKTLDKTEETR